MSSRREDEAIAGVGGGAVGQGAYQQAGYATKHRVDRLTRKPHVAAEQIRMQDRALRANKSRFGMHQPQGSPGRDNAGYHRAYPKELPHARTIRTLGHTHEGKIGVLVGTGATVGGAALAAGAVHHETKVNKMDDSPFLVAKYEAGTITLHHEQAQMHARKKASASRGVAYGVGAAGLGAGAFLGSETIGREVGSATRSIKRGTQAKKVAHHGGLGLAAAGTTLAAGSLVRRVHHARKQNVETKAAQRARVERNAAMAKSAFGVEVSKKRLTAAERNALPASDFADPKNRRFPMNDKAHAENALARAHQGFAGGKLKRKIERKEGAMVAKSAFDVEHEIDKGMASILDSGISALKGVKTGISGTPGVASNLAQTRGVTAGAAVRDTASAGIGKLKPLGAMAQANPGKTALIGGGAGALGIGIGRKSKQ